MEALLQPVKFGVADICSVQEGYQIEQTQPGDLNSMIQESEEMSQGAHEVSDPRSRTAKGMVGWKRRITRRRSSFQRSLRSYEMVISHGDSEEEKIGKEIRYD